MMVQRLIPCPTCVSRFQDKTAGQYSPVQGSEGNLWHHFRNPQYVRQFELPTCALAAVNHETIICAEHPGVPVALSSLVPDLLLSDLPPYLLIDTDKFEFEPIESNRLGEGGAGEVYKGSYRDVPVAIKRFHATRNTR